MDHSTILKWAAGSSKLLPNHLDFDEDVLIELVDIHNLSGRFLQRLANHDAPSFTPKLKEAIQDLHSQMKRQVVQNMNSVRQINQQLLPTTEIIVIKGVSTYVLVGKESTMRLGDIDVLSNNTKTLVNVLSKMNYKQTRAPFLHEVGEYTKGSIEVDIHDHFPVYSYTDSILNADLAPHNNLGIWYQNYKMNQCKITYDDLLNNSFLGNMPDTMNIKVPDPNILTIIICAHAFMNYTNIWSISHRKKAYIRLGEIADLFDLVNHTAFNRKKFLSLVKQFDAADAVEWAANITSMLFGKNPLPIHSTTNRDEELPNARFPRCLWWNFWADIPSGTDELIQKQWLSMDLLTKEIGANILTAEHGTTGKYATYQCEGSTPLQHFITQNVDPVLLVLEVSTIRTGVMIHLKVLSDLKADIDRIRIDFGNEASEWIYSVDTQDQILVGAPADISFNRHSSSYEICLKYSWEMLGQSVQNAKNIALLIGVGKQSSCDGLIASILIPLVINFNL